MKFLRLDPDQPAPPLEDGDYGSRPACEACGDSDESVGPVRVTRRMTVDLCATCGACEPLLADLASEKDM